MNILFVCTHNACRSILAETIARELAGDRLVVASAGSEPSGRVHPLTTAFLEAAGYPTDGLRSKGFDDLDGFDPDIVITVCDSAASEPCPAWLGNGALVAHWGLPDPSRLDGTAAERQAAFEAVAATLRSRLSAFLEAPFEAMDRPALARLLELLAER